jgi:Nitrile hydratase beta subunit
MIERSHHDMGGQPAGKVRRNEHAGDRSYSDWEMRVDAMMLLLIGVTGMKKRMTVDELRKNIEALPPADYDKMGYYDRWVISLTQTMIQRGVFTTDDLARKLAEVEKRGQGRENRGQGRISEKR